MTWLPRDKKYPALIVLIFLLAECLVNPLGDFPLNDDWSYAVPVKTLLETGQLDIGIWPGMSLVTHVYYGAAFAKIFGFSFFVLRLSTLLSGCAGLLLLFGLVKRLTNSEDAGLTCALALMFNPMFFSLSNTFMTDVNFCTLLVLGLYGAERVLIGGKYMHLLIVFGVSVALTMLRQFGILFPICFALSALFVKGKLRLWSVLTGLAGFGLSWLILQWFEAYHARLHNTLIAYQFVTKGTTVPPLDVIFGRACFRVPEWFMQVLVYASPLALAGLIPAFKSHRLIAIISLVAGIILSYRFLDEVNWLCGNIFSNMNLGAETFYQSLKFPENEMAHTYSPLFRKITYVAGLVLSSATLSYVFVAIARFVQGWKSRHTRFAFQLLMMLFGLVYMGALLKSQSNFDRYVLPLLIIGLLLLSRFDLRLNFLSLIVISLFGFISIAGTRDYMRINAIKWNLFDQVVVKANVPFYRIHAGFEPMGWNNGQPLEWLDLLPKRKFVVQYSPEPGYRRIYGVPFRRFFPWKRDTVYLMRRDSTTLAPQPKNAK